MSLSMPSVVLSTLHALVTFRIPVVVLVNSTSHESVAEVLTATLVLVVLTVSLWPGPSRQLDGLVDDGRTGAGRGVGVQTEPDTPVRSPAPAATVMVAESFG